VDEPCGEEPENRGSRGAERAVSRKNGYRQGSGTCSCNGPGGARATRIPDLHDAGISASPRLPTDSMSKVPWHSRRRGPGQRCCGPPPCHTMRPAHKRTGVRAFRTSGDRRGACDAPSGCAPGADRPAGGPPGSDERVGGSGPASHPAMDIALKHRAPLLYPPGMSRSGRELPNPRPTLCIAAHGWRRRRRAVREVRRATASPCPGIAGTSPPSSMPCRRPPTARPPEGSATL